MTLDAELIIIPITYLGVIAAAISGVLEARKKEMDIVGATTVAFITALGGGSVRDMLLGHLPVFWVTDSSYAILAFFVAILSFYLIDQIPEKFILVPDALGLGVFSVLGATYALQSNTSLFVASLMGVVTGVFGGILRDVICNQIPNVFDRSAELYATCSFIGTWVFLLLVKAGTGLSAASLIAITATFLLRILAMKYKIKLPNLSFGGY
jgi:uncharacterized membrane protein YeiH